MDCAKSYMGELREIAGKTIAVVYIFEGESALGAQHYAVWQADVISAWIKAIQELRCMPLILDVKTFVNKAMNGTLPQLDYVINLNNGTKDLSALSLVPSACAFIGVPCIPCNAFTALIGENKLVSNTIARALNINTPKDLADTSDNGINRPINFGSSIGVIKGQRTNQSGLYQEFIPGFDMTTPLLYHPLHHRLEVLPPVMYQPDSRDPQWFLGAAEKQSHSSYRKQIVQISPEVRSHFLSLASYFGITSFCRIDSRVKCHSKEEMDALAQSVIPYQQVFFVEINPMPTISEGINFLTSLQSVSQGHPFYESLHIYNDTVPEHSLTGFILSCAIISQLKAMH